MFNGSYWGFSKGSISGGNSVSVPSGADNLGNHTATTTLNLNNQSISSLNGLIFNNGSAINKSASLGLFVSTVKVNFGTDFDLKFLNTVNINGSGSYAGTWDNVSDLKFKRDIQNLENALDKVNQLRGVNFNYRVEDYPNFNFPTKFQDGFIAQEVLPFIPEAVSQNQNGDYFLDYTRIIPYLVEAIKEQQAEIEQLKLVNKNGGSSENNLMMQNEKGAKLFQNIPNPFNQKTTIGYELSERTSNAFIMICDLTGKQIRKVSLTQKGQSQIEIQAGELSAGIYFYSLIADGKEVDTKKMILTE